MIWRLCTVFMLLISTLSLYSMDGEASPLFTRPASALDSHAHYEATASRFLPSQAVLSDLIAQVFAVPVSIPDAETLKTNYINRVSTAAKSVSELINAILLSKKSDYQTRGAEYKEKAAGIIKENEKYLCALHLKLLSMIKENSFSLSKAVVGGDISKSLGAPPARTSVFDTVTRMAYTRFVDDTYTLGTEDEKEAAYNTALYAFFTAWVDQKKLDPSDKYLTRLTTRIERTPRAVFNILEKYSTDFETQLEHIQALVKINEPAIPSGLLNNLLTEFVQARVRRLEDSIKKFNVFGGKNLKHRDKEKAEAAADSEEEHKE